MQTFNKACSIGDRELYRLYDYNFPLPGPFLKMWAMPSFYKNCQTPISISKTKKLCKRKQTKQTNTNTF